MKMILSGREVDVNEIDVKFEGPSQENLFIQEEDLSNSIGLTVYRRSPVSCCSVLYNAEKAKFTMDVTYKDLRRYG